MPRRKQRDRHLEVMLAGYLDTSSSGAEDDSLTETFDEKAAYERSSLSLQVLRLIGDGMRSQGLTQKQLADRLEVSEGRVSQILSGDSNLTMRTLASLAAALDGHLRIELESGAGDHGDPKPRTDDASSEAPTRPRVMAR